MDNYLWLKLRGLNLVRKSYFFLSLKGETFNLKRDSLSIINYPLLNGNLPLQIIDTKIDLYSNSLDN